jgi:hypothetical protein
MGLGLAGSGEKVNGSAGGIWAIRSSCLEEDACRSSCMVEEYAGSEVKGYS